MKVIIDNATLLRKISNDKRFVSKEFYRAESNGHKFKVGEMLTLTGLEDFPEFNGQQVEITAIRQDGARGKAYYVEGAINEFINWVYEYRLEYRVE